MPPPRSVLSAVRLMYAGAALELLALIIAVVTRASLKVAILARHPFYNPAQVHHAEAAPGRPPRRGVPAPAGVENAAAAPQMPGPGCEPSPQVTRLTST